VWPPTVPTGVASHCISWIRISESSRCVMSATTSLVGQS
jgi:hypothetical protein